VHGHVGNSAALFALQLLGIGVTAVPTVLFSNHPRYSSVHGKVLDAALLRDLFAGVEEPGLVDNCKVGALEAAAQERRRPLLLIMGTRLR
jgi:pyridoxine kinase